MILGNKYISLFGEKAVGEGIVDAVTREMSSEREIRRSLHVSVSLWKWSQTRTQGTTKQIVDLIIY